MEILNNIPHAFPRSFVPMDLDFAEWKYIEPLFLQLEHRVLDTKEQLQQWLYDRSELMDVINEEGALRYIRMTCNTADKELEAAYFHFLEEISERVKEVDDRLKRKYLQALSRQLLPASTFAIMDRSFENDVALFREENLPLETEESKLSQNYQKLMGS